MSKRSLLKNTDFRASTDEEIRLSTAFYYRQLNVIVNRKSSSLRRVVAGQRNAKIASFRQLNSLPFALSCPSTTRLTEDVFRRCFSCRL